MDIIHMICIGGPVALGLIVLGLIIHAIPKVIEYGELVDIYRSGDY